MSGTTNNSKTAFNKLDASEEAIDSGNGITEIESVCMNCYKNVNFVVNSVFFFL